MPVFNDFSHYYVGGGHPTTPSYTSSGYAAHSSSASSPYSYPSSYSNRTHSNYFPSNYPSTNLLSTITGSGITARYYTGNKKNSNYVYKGTRGNYTDKFTDTKTPAYTPSPYTTYSLWKENQIASKWRNDNYRWNHLKDGPRTTKPVYIDTAKINVNKPRTKRPEPPPVPEPIPERSVLVEKPMVRDEQLGTIKRGRTVVRMHTKMLKENPYLKKNEKSDHSEAEEEMECRFNRMSPVRISRLKKRSVLQYKRHDSGNKHWLDSESSDNDSDNDSISRKSTVKSRKISRSGTIKRDGTIKNKDDLTREDTVKRRYNKTTHSKDLSQSIDSVHKSGGEIKKTDRRLSLEMYEEQTAILDSMIKAELAREDADDYFSDPKRGTVKIKGKNTSKINTMGQSTDSNTDEEDTKKKGRRLSRAGQKNEDADCASEKSTPSSSRRNSLFQDLIIGETINENFIEDLENKIQNSYTNTEKVLKDSMPKLRLGTVKISQKLAKKPSRFDIQPSNSDAKISSIVEVEEKPKTPKFFIEDVKIEANKFSFDDDKNEALSQASKKDNTDKKVIEKESTNILKKDPLIKQNEKDNIRTKGVEDNKQVSNKKETVNILKKDPMVKRVEDQSKPGPQKNISKQETTSTNILKKDPPLKKTEDKKDTTPPLLKQVEDQNKSSLEKDTIETKEIEKNIQVQKETITPTKVTNILKEESQLKKTEDSSIEAKEIDKSVTGQKEMSIEKLETTTTNLLKKDAPLKKNEDSTIGTKEIEKSVPGPEVNNSKQSSSMQKPKTNISDELFAADKSTTVLENSTKTSIKKLELAKPEKKQTELKNIPKADVINNDVKKAAAFSSTGDLTNPVPAEKASNVKKGDNILNGDYSHNNTKIKEELSERHNRKNTDKNLIENSVNLAVIETLSESNFKETSNSKDDSEKENSSMQNVINSSQQEMIKNDNSEIKAEQITKLPIKIIKPPTKDLTIKTQGDTTLQKELEKKEDNTKVNEKSKSSSPKVSSANEAKKQTDVNSKKEPVKIPKSVSPDKSKKDLNTFLPKSPPKEDAKPKLEEKPISVKTKTKINLESNKKTTKMKEERKTIKASQKESKMGSAEKKIAEKLEIAEEKSEQSNQKGNTVQMTAKKSTHRKKESSKPRKASAIVHMKPRAMAIRTVENHPPSLKTPRLFPLPQPTKAVIEIIPSAPFEESESSDESDDESTATEGSSDECSETSSDDSSSSLQGNQRNSTSSLDSGFGSACYKTKKGIALQIRVVY